MESLQIQKRLRLYLRFGRPGVDSFYFKEITGGKLCCWRKPPISRFLLFPTLKVDTQSVKSTAKFMEQENQVGEGLSLSMVLI